MIQKERNTMNPNIKNAINDTDELIGTVLDKEHLQQAFDASQRVGNGVLDFIISMVTGWLYGTCLTIMMVLVHPFKAFLGHFMSEAEQTEQPKSRALVRK
jgi:hypothetical protein